MLTERDSGRLLGGQIVGMDTYADNLSELIESLELTGAALIGFSANGVEVARYIGRHGTKRVAKAALISDVSATDP